MNTAGAQLYNLYKSMAILLKATYLLQGKKKMEYTILLDEKKKIKRNDEEDDDGRRCNTSHA